MRVSTVLATTLAVTVVTAASAQAIQLADGTVYFAEPPALVAATSTFKEINVWGATYYFILNLPDNAGEPLQKVTFTQKQGTQDIRFDLKDTRAFEGTPDRVIQRFSLSSVTRDRKTQTVEVTFNPPVSPGKTVTIGLRPYQNPAFSGIYLYGVTAFPAGERSHGQFLGFGRLQFYGDGRGFFGFP